MVLQVIYVSTPDQNLKISEVENIVEIARMNNMKHSITGFFCGNSKYFVQCIEGEKNDVNALFAKIKQDSRHHDIQLLREVEVAERSFGDWSMGVVLGMEKHLAILKRYSNSSGFSPYQLNSDQCLQLLMDFSNLRING